MAEIAENLHRREIGEIERAEMVAKWVELVTSKADQKPRQVADVSTLKAVGGRGKKGGYMQAARDLGMEETAVRRAVKVAKTSLRGSRRELNSINSWKIKIL
ncbi:hypothetical protein [Camelimonas lactis]|uniref:hypothetical protein n=1 Tax=Camelimonas lactis TaxID=659006 RepID=UPI001FE1786A|nr:hypothetical protein [Camelimonas lactis]